MNSHFRQVIFFVILLGIPLTAWYTIFRPQNAEITAAYGRHCLASAAIGPYLTTG